MITIGNGINVHGSITMNGIRIDLSKPLQTCRAILQLVSDEDKEEFAREILEELGSPSSDGHKASNPIVTESRDVAPFKEIEILSNCNVEYRQGQMCKLTIKGKKKDIEKVHTRVEGNTLIISEEEDTYTTGNVTVMLESPTLRRVDTGGNGDFTATGKVSGINEQLEITSSRGGNVEFEEVLFDGINADVTSSGEVTFRKISANDVSASVCGSGDINFDKAAITMNASLFVQGSGDVRLNGNAKYIRASVTGSGDIRGTVRCDRLTAKVTGSGDINFRGDILSHTKSVVGSGDIHIG